MAARVTGMPRRGLGVVVVPIVKPSDAAGEELPGLGDLGTAAHRGQRVIPSAPGAADYEGELPAAVTR